MSIFVYSFIRILVVYATITIVRFFFTYSGVLGPDSTILAVSCQLVYFSLYLLCSLSLSLSFIFSPLIFLLFFVVHFYCIFQAITLNITRSRSLVCLLVCLSVCLSVFLSFCQTHCQRAPVKASANLFSKRVAFCADLNLFPALLSALIHNSGKIATHGNCPAASEADVGALCIMAAAF